MAHKLFGIKLTIDIDRFYLEENLLQKALQLTKRATREYKLSILSRYNYFSETSVTIFYSLFLFAVTSSANFFCIFYFSVKSFTKAYSSPTTVSLNNSSHVCYLLILSFVPLATCQNLYLLSFATPSTEIVTGSAVLD
ncbi:MAG: hypothetical protein ACI90V_001450 [Bacillariaceae sp.]|jgi:hypothetical protein